MKSVELKCVEYFQAPKQN